MKKNYNQPSVEVTLMMSESIMQAGSPNILQNSGSGTSGLGGGDPIIGG